MYSKDYKKLLKEIKETIEELENVADNSFSTKFFLGKLSLLTKSICKYYLNDN